MIDQLIEKLRSHTGLWNQFGGQFVEKKIPSKTILLREGEISTHIHFIKNGCLRLWFNKDGKDITLQFFFENQMVASVESFMNEQPGMFFIESIEPSTIISIEKNCIEAIHQEFPELREHFYTFIFNRFCNYARLFLSRIKDSPQERYLDLLQNHPDIIKRVPQHYIASYLGITPISLSRIRNRK